MKTILAALAVSFAMPALAQQGPTCGQYTDMAEEISSRYGEQVRFVGLDTRNLITVLFANEDTGSWTALVVQTDGKACMVAAGNNAELPAAEPEGTDG